MVIVLFLLLAIAAAQAGAVCADEIAANRNATTHWSLLPLASSKVDERGLKNANNPIDVFVFERLNAHQLEPSPPADRLTLLRRLSFDLTGLPPTPAEIDFFVHDRSPLAYETLVERLLASPRYGERWGRHWLDVARYTESQGFEYDRLRDHAWHYRDYIIQCFNEDRPYDRFMREQIAGDVMEPITSAGIIATSLLVCGPWDQAGNSQSNVTQRMITREDELEDLIGVVGQTFLGLSVNCARCHDHKFDPIPHEEYYRIKSVFEGVKHGERSILTNAEATTASDIVSYVGIRVQPSPTKRLERGDVNSPDEVVTPGALSAISILDADFGLAADCPEALRRLKFADWLADPRNPLPARVMANRIWHWHFGRGLVAEPNDFGVSGSRPTHPELLDWLATQFIASGWSVKTLQRLIVNSTTYKQSSQFNEVAHSIDADNQWLWRFTPQRLEAEAVRDAMLAASGQLNSAMGGPSFRPFTTTEFNATFYTPVDGDDPEFNRRTVYRANVNSGKDPLLDSFDCPDPAIKTPRRGVTTTPLQSLEMMNNAFVQRQAKHLAQHATQSAKGNVNRVIETVYLLTIGRMPNDDELHRAVAATEQRGLFSICWALLNSTEFIYAK